MTVALIIALSAGCTLRQTTQAEHAWQQRALAFQATVADLADPTMEGRGLGTAGLERARDYLVNHMMSVGLLPAFGRGHSTAYTQRLEIDLGVTVATQSLAIGNGQPFNAGVDFNAMGLSANGFFSGQAVFVGYGIEAHGYNSFASLGENALKGKVAVAFRYEPITDRGDSRWADEDEQSYGGWSSASFFSNKAKWAAQRGAAALLIVNPPSHGNSSSLLSTQRTAQTKSALVVMHLSQRAFEQLLAGHSDQPRILAKQLQRRADRGQTDTVELPEVSGRVELEHSKVTISNVAGVVPGRGQLAHEAVIIGAHYDHLGYGRVGSVDKQQVIHPGADDNASGVAAMLLLAKELANDEVALRRTVIFIAFAGEEHGLLGSAHLVNHLDELHITPQQIAAMINLDMIGRLRDDQLVVFGVSSGDRWKQLLRRANRQTNLRLRFDKSAIGPSDHLHFYTKNIPVLHFFTAMHSDYHRPSDIIDKINAIGGAKIITLIEALVSELAGDPRRLEFVKDAQ